MAMFPEMAYGFLEEDTRKQIEGSSVTRKIIFEKLVVGVNISGTEAYQRVASCLLKVPENRLKELTIEDIEKEVGEYRDMSGYLV
jgi:hypothetical protein